MSQVYTINKFYRGLAGDDYLGSDGSYLYSENLDFREYYNGIQLGRGVNVIGSTLQEMTGFCEFKKDGVTSYKTFAYGEDGKFYNMSGVSLGGLSGAYYINNAIAFGSYVLVFYEDGGILKIGRITKEDAYDNYDVTNGFTGRITENAISYGTGFRSSYDQYPVLNYVDETLFFGNGKKLFKLNVDEAAASAVFSNELEDEIVGLTEYSGLFKIYLRNGKILFWDGESDGFVAITNIHNSIRTVYGYGDTDYILAGLNEAYSEFHILQGYQTQLIQRVIYSRAENKYLYALGETGGTSRPNIMGKRLGLLYIGANFSSDAGLYSYGTDLLGTGNSFNIEAKTDEDGDAITAINAIKISTSAVYIAYTAGGSDKLGYIDLNVAYSGLLQETGTWISRIFDGSTRTTKKQLKEIKVKTDGTTSTNTITIYIKRNAGNWEEVGVCNISGTDNYEFIQPFDPFYDIQFKAVFSSGGTTTAALQEISMIYDIIE